MVQDIKSETSGLCSELSPTSFLQFQAVITGINATLTLLNNPFQDEFAQPNSDNNNSTSWSLFFEKYWYIVIFRRWRMLFRHITVVVRLVGLLWVTLASVLPNQATTCCKIAADSFQNWIQELFTQRWSGTIALEYKMHMLCLWSYCIVWYLMFVFCGFYAWAWIS